MVDRHDEKALYAGPEGHHGALAKLSMPRSVKGVARPRLHTALDEARRAAAVWIVAPCGSGKTTLAATYIAERKLSSLWYQLDKDDADPATFFYYLGMAAKRLQPDREIFLPLLTPEFLHDIPGFARRYFRQLFALLPRESVIVLDNYQDLSGAEVVDEVLRNIIGEVPERSNIIVLSRSAPPPVLARLQVTAALELLTWEDLRLSYDETETIVKRSGKALDPKIIRALHGRSEGWVAALALMLKPFKKKGVGDQGIGLDSLESVFDYFASEFFDDLPVATREFLLQTSLLSHVTPSLAMAVSGNNDAEKILATLYRQHFFTSRRDLSEITYQYHALFREFLLARVVESYSREQYLELTRRVGGLLEAHGRGEEAVGLYLQARAWEEAITLILVQAPLLLSQARPQIVAGWIKCIPEEKVGATPWLLFWRGISQQFVDPFAAQTTLERAYQGFVDERDVLGQLSAASAIVDIIFFLRESLLSAASWIEVLQNYLATNLEFPSVAIEARILSSLFSVLTYMRPQDPQLPRYAERLMVLLDADLEVNQRVLMGAHLVNYYAHAVGDINTCERIVMRITPLLSSPRVTVVNHMLWRSFSVLPSLLSGNGDAAYEAVEPLLALARDNNLPFMEPIASFYLMLVHLFRGEMRAAQPLMEEMTLKVNTSQPADVAWLYLARCWYALAQGDYPTAFNQGRAALQAVSGVGAELTAMDINCLIALERCHSGNYDEALEYLAMPRKMVFGNSPRLHHQVLLVEAYAYLGKGDRSSCRQRLREAFAIGSQQCFYGSIYCWFPDKVMTRLCSEALRAGIEVDYTQGLILRRNLLPEDLNIENWPWPVRIYTLGSFKLVINGQLHSLESKAQYKPLRLLKVLVAMGGADVKEERISEILWPDAEGDAAHSAFTTTLSRLRKLIGDQAVTVKYGRLSLHKLYCWVDTWSFEDQLAQWQKIGSDPVRLRALAGRIVTLYRGPFMNDEDGAWVERVRERLQSRYFRFISAYGRTLMASQDQRGQTLHPVEPGLEMDPCGDDFYRGLMASYAAAGQSAEALAAYNRCRDILGRDIGVLPPTEGKMQRRSIE